MVGTMGRTQQINSHLAARIRRRRIELDVPQRVLAEALGVTPQAFSKLEAGKTAISARALSSVASILATPVGFFFEGLRSSR